jgi:hypothetical protein
MTWETTEAFNDVLHLGNSIFLGGFSTGIFVNLADFSSKEWTMGDGWSYKVNRFLHNTMSNAVALEHVTPWGERSWVFVDENLEVDIFPDFLNVTNPQYGIINFEKTGSHKYLFFSLYGHYPSEKNNWEKMRDLSYIFRCENLDNITHVCGTPVTTFPQSKIQSDYSNFADWVVATVYQSDEIFFKVRVKDVINQWNSQTRTVFINVMMLGYDDRNILQSNSTNKKLLWSAALNKTDLSPTCKNCGRDRWVFDNSQSGMDLKFKCYDSVNPEDIETLENAKFCKTAAINGIPFLYPWLKVHYYNKFFYGASTNNMAKGTILFNLQPTYKITQKSSTKSDRLTILMTIAGIISPLIATFRLLKTHSYRQENKAEINREDGIKMSNIEGTLRTEI